MNNLLTNYLIIFGGTILLSNNVAFAHGSNLKYRYLSTVEVTATYDDGQPMKNAQFVIYSPNNPSIPWQKGVTDQQGTFQFIPDIYQTGNWDIKVRQAGHGELISIPINPQVFTTVTNKKNESLMMNSTPLQKIVMTALGIWGFIGTGLFFSYKKRPS